MKVGISSPHFFVLPLYRVNRRLFYNIHNIQKQSEVNIWFMRKLLIYCILRAYAKCQALYIFTNKWKEFIRHLCASLQLHLKLRAFWIINPLCSNSLSCWDISIGRLLYFMCPYKKRSPAVVRIVERRGENCCCKDMV